MNRFTRRLAKRALDKLLKCEVCGHSTNAHTRKLPEFASMDDSAFYELIFKTRNGARFPECLFFFCDKCETPKEIIRLCGHSSTSICGCNCQ